MTRNQALKFLEKQVGNAQKAILNNPNDKIVIVYSKDQIKYGMKAIKHLKKLMGDA